MKQETTGKQFAESADKVITVTRKQTAVKTIFEKTGSPSTPYSPQSQN